MLRMLTPGVPMCTARRRAGRRSLASQAQSRRGLLLQALQARSMTAAFIRPSPFVGE